MADLTAQSSQEEKLSVGGSLLRHRAWLLGVALLPLASYLGGAILGFHSERFTVVFVLLIVALTPLWDYTRCRAPYTLWIVAIGIWMASFCLASALMPL
jgi:hypothetical protein